MIPEKAKIGHLWQEFFTKCEQVGIVPGQGYGVYSNFASDWHGAFDVTAGVKGEFNAEEKTEITVPSGTYLRFEKSGPLPETVQRMWQDIWQYFQDDDAPERSYICDFEAYIGTDTAAVYIGIKDHG